MDIYVVLDYDRNIDGIYDKKGILKIYPTLVINPPHYKNMDYWDHCSVIKYTLNSDEGISLNPEDIRMPLGRNKA